LLLLNRLELQILNASDGCATGTLPAVPRPSLVFFRTNKKTCQDYFSRIRPNMIKGAKLARSDDLMIVNIMKVCFFFLVLFAAYLLMFFFVGFKGNGNEYVF
jgi:hypothetical protein